MEIIWAHKMQTFFILPTLCTVVADDGKRRVMLVFLHSFIGVAF